jgi:hypothetical protein
LRWNLSFGKRKKSHGLRSGKYGGFGTTGLPLFGQNFFHGDGSVDGEHSRHAASKCPHAHFLSQNVVDSLVIQIQLPTDHPDCQTSIILHDSPHVIHIFFRFWRASFSRTRFIFHNLTAIQNALCRQKTCALDRACSP